jgi:hypothetical protein
MTTVALVNSGPPFDVILVPIENTGEIQRLIDIGYIPPNNRNHNSNHNNNHNNHNNHNNRNKKDLTT